MIGKFFLLLTVLSSTLLILHSESFAESEKNQCENVLDGTKLFLAFECLNDSTVVVINSSKQTPSGWQYSSDSHEDGVTFGRVGGEEFELYGIAVKETASEVLIVIKGNLPLGGFSSSNVLNGNINWGDLFIDLTYTSDFVSVSSDKLLSAIRFSASNDSAAETLGVYGKVSAKSVSQLNQGFRDWRHYRDYVVSRGKVGDLGDLGIVQSYYSDEANQNVIDTSSKLGEIEFLGPEDLSDSDFDPSQLDGIVSIAFKFKKNLVIDECGVPGGDGSSCIDCAGIFCGSTKVDQCGVCGGDGTSCLDCNGTPFGSLEVDQCGVCGGDGTSCLDCDGVAFGDKVFDICDVCGGDGTSCLDCDENPFGGLEFDVCGVCGGDGTSCLDCSGEPFGIEKFDQCGVCGGDGTSCTDCKGTPFGTAMIDQCGVCGGDDKSCVDCKGIPNGSSVLDACGVCDGDGKSCLNCTDTNISETQTILDGHTVAQRHWNLYAIKRLSKIDRSEKLQKFVSNVRKDTEDLYLKNWNLVWSIPSIQTKCENELLCSSVDNSKNLILYKDNAKTLNRLLLLITKKISRRSTRGKSLARRLKKKGKVLLKRSLADTADIPEVRSVCAQRGPGLT